MATIKDVAARAGVSTATVSYVINGTGTVTEATRQRVLTVIAELDYRPNYAARSLRTRPRTLGLVLPTLAERLADPTLAELVAGLSAGAAEANYYLLLATVSQGQSEAELGAQLTLSGRIDGLVLFDLRSDDERLGYLQERGVPFICAGRPAGVDAAYVAFDLVGGAQTATRHLIAQGHRRIALIDLPSDLADSEPFFAGYAAALEAACLELDPLLTIEAGSSQDDGMAAMLELLDTPEPPTAVLAASDALAFGAMHALRDAGIAVGSGIALIGYGDVPLAAHTHPPLTTLRAQRATMGRELAGRLIAQIEGRHHETPGLILPLHLIVRRSTE
ncbi:MAG: LacI family transcriptional regulator [Oscillochloris sp.]|nr:LacI family transcriptional regulator [Oscillochloris sp.]